MTHHKAPILSGSHRFRTDFSAQSIPSIAGNATSRQGLLNLGTLLFLAALCGIFLPTSGVHAQERDLRAERLVIDDNASDGTSNTMTIQTESSLGQNVVVIIPDMGSDSVKFMLLPYGSAGAWLLGGNTGLTPGSDYLGTGDSTALHFYVNGGANNALVLDTNGSLQHGITGNARGVEAVDLQFSGGAANRVASGDYSVIAGGHGNRVDDTHSSIGGGEDNQIYSDHGVIGGGDANYIGVGRRRATIGGGFTNRIVTDGESATIAGGRSNSVSAERGTIGGGEGNAVEADYGTIPGGRQNAILPGAYQSTIGGGGNNTVDSTANASTIAGGNSNQVGTGATHSSIGGGDGNQILADHGVIGGGEENSIETGRRRSTIGGGYRNSIGTSGESSTISGGRDNSISKERGTIGGGENNTINGAYSTIGGGSSNSIQSAGGFSVIGGGINNSVTQSRSAIPGGAGLTLSGDASFGFLGNELGTSNMTVSADNTALFGNTDLWLANNEGGASRLLFYEATSDTGVFPNGTNYTSFEAQGQTADIEYILPAAAGTVGQQLTISGVSGTEVTLGWAAASDRAKKTDFRTLSGEGILRKFRGINLGTWRYDPTIDPKGTRHYGIMAQDFQAAFGNDDLGAIGTDTTVTDIDLHGVSYLAIQGLEERTSVNIEKIETQARTIREQARRIEDLEERLRIQDEEMSRQIRMLRQTIEGLPREERR